VIAYPLWFDRGSIWKNWITKPNAQITTIWLTHERRTKVNIDLRSTAIFPTWKRSALRQIQLAGPCSKLKPDVSQIAKAHHPSWNGGSWQRPFFCRSGRCISAYWDSRPLQSWFGRKILEKNSIVHMIQRDPEAAIAIAFGKTSNKGFPQ